MNFLGDIYFRRTFTNGHIPVEVCDSCDGGIHGLKFRKLECLRNFGKVTPALPLRPQGIPLILVLSIWNDHASNIVLCF